MDDQWPSERPTGKSENSLAGAGAFLPKAKAESTTLLKKKVAGRWDPAVGCGMSSSLASRLGVNCPIKSFPLVSVSIRAASIQWP